MEEERVGKTRTIGTKAAKDAKVRRKLGHEEENVIKKAFNALSKMPKEDSSANMAAAKARIGQEKIDNDREFQLEHKADQLEATKVLFDDDSEESRSCRLSLKKTRCGSYKKRRSRKTRPRLRQLSHFTTAPSPF